MGKMNLTEATMQVLQGKSLGENISNELDIIEIEDAILKAAQEILDQRGVDYKKYTNPEMKNAVKFDFDGSTFVISVNEMDMIDTQDLDESKNIKTEAKGLLKNIELEDDGYDELNLYSADIDDTDEAGKALINSFKDYETNASDVIKNIRIEYNYGENTILVEYVDTDGEFHEIDYKLTDDEIAKLRKLGHLDESKNIKTESEDLSYMDSDCNRCRVYYAVNSSGYKSLGLVVNDKDKKFQVVYGQQLGWGHKTAKKSKKQIWEMAKDLYENGYEEVRGPSSVVGSVKDESKNIKTESIGYDAGICPKCNSEDLEYGTIETESDDYVIYPFQCNNCGAKGVERYLIDFVEIESKDENKVNESKNIKTEARNPENDEINEKIRKSLNGSTKYIKDLEDAGLEVAQNENGRVEAVGAITKADMKKASPDMDYYNYLTKKKVEPEVTDTGAFTPTNIFRNSDRFEKVSGPARYGSEDRNGVSKAIPKRYKTGRKNYGYDPDVFPKRDYNGVASYEPLDNKELNDFKYNKSQVADGGYLKQDLDNAKAEYDKAKDAYDTINNKVQNVRDKIAKSKEKNVKTEAEESSSFLNDEINVYDIDAYVKKVAGEKYQTMEYQSGAAIFTENSTSGKFVIADYEAIGFHGDDTSKEFKLGIATIPEDEHTIKIFPEYEMKTSIKEIMETIQPTKSTFADFFTKRNYNSRCVDNFAELVESLKEIGVLDENAKIEEARNPENDEINMKIRKTLNGSKKYIKDLEDAGLRVYQDGNVNRTVMDADEDKRWERFINKEDLKDYGPDADLYNIIKKERPLDRNEVAANNKDMGGKYSSIKDRSRGYDNHLVNQAMPKRYKSGSNDYEGWTYSRHRVNVTEPYGAQSILDYKHADDDIEKEKDAIQYRQSSLKDLKKKSKELQDRIQDNENDIAKYKDNIKKIKQSKHDIVKNRRAELNNKNN